MVAALSVFSVMVDLPGTWEGVEVSAQKHAVLLRRLGVFDGREDRGWTSYPRRRGCRKGTIVKGRAAPTEAVRSAGKIAIQR